MLELEAPDLEAVPVLLALQHRSTKKPRTSPPNTLEGRMFLGGPLVTRLDEQLLEHDPTLRAYFNQEKDQWAFWLIQAACSFKRTDEPIVSAELKFLLSAPSAAACDAPIAWSMHPARLSATAELSHKAKLGAKLKFVFHAVEAGAESTEKVEASLPFLLAMAEGTHQPFWDFRDIAARPLEGLFRLSLIVRGPKSGPTSLKIMADNVNVAYKGRVFRYVAILDTTRMAQLTLS